MSKQLNRIKVILAEKQLTNKWLADELHRDQTTCFQVGDKYLPAKF